jgi:hypothetical protein
MRLKTAVLTAVLAGSLAGPSVVGASASSRSRSVNATRATSASRTRAGVRGQDATADPVGVLESVISEIEVDLSGANIQSLLWDLPGFGPY